MPTPFATANSTVVRMTAGSPPCQPQAMLAEVMTSISSASFPSCHRPKLSPISEFKSIVRTISDSLHIRFVNERFGRARQVRSFVYRQLFESDVVTTRHHLAELPHRSVGNAGRADEAAQGRSVDAEDDWLVAGDVHRADRVAIVEDVGGMPTRDPAGRARPLPAMRLQPVAHAIGVPIELPVVAEEMLVVIPGPVVRRGLRSRDGLQLPLRGVAGDDRGVHSAAGKVIKIARRVPDREPIPFPERTAFETTDRTRHVRRAATQVGWHVDATADREVGAKSSAGDAAQDEGLAGPDPIRPPEVDRVAVELRLHIRPGEGDHRVRIESSLEIPGGDLE